jgi:hypothetical protein
MCCRCVLAVISTSTDFALLLDLAISPEFTSLPIADPEEIDGSHRTLCLPLKSQPYRCSFRLRLDVSQNEPTKRIRIIPANTNDVIVDLQ